MLKSTFIMFLELTARLQLFLPKITYFLQPTRFGVYLEFCGLSGSETISSHQVHFQKECAINEDVSREGVPRVETKVQQPLL